MNKLTIYSAGSFRYALLELTRAFKHVMKWKLNAYWVLLVC